MSVAEASLHKEIARLNSVLADARGVAERAERRLQELSHRVKNEFHQIAALARLQERENSEPDRCRRCASNITAFSELHRLLDIAGMELVSMHDYFISLERSLGLALDRQCRFTASADDDILLPPQPAARLGIILTEAAINAAKHAFPEGVRGGCQATLERDGADLRLTVRDNGRGMAENAGPGRGADLIRAMSEQMGGRVDYPETDTGLIVQVTIPSF